MKVIKRDGREVPFDKGKIEQAILKAFVKVDGFETEESVSKSKFISEHIAKEKRNLTVEEIQDAVEKKLMNGSRKDVAKEYIIYRNERTKVREKNSNLIQKVFDRINAANVENSNANVDENSFSGREKEASSDVQKFIALELDGLSEPVAKAHKEMLIYQHDLDKAILGQSNCLNVDFGEIFKYGFTTRNGDVRPPSSFSTACQLVAVAFQCQSQIQFGGVGSIHLDFDLAPFVKKSFLKHYADGLRYVSELVKYSEDQITEIIEYLKHKEIDDDSWNIKSKHYQYAIDMLEREGLQSAQGLYHNLNTLESRQGSQVPFTSINVGRDTSIEGRLVTKWIMQASLDGIGKHHLTSIFPISIFQYKKGTNASKEDPNYDLKKLALTSMSKRIYPNWCNGDWSQANEDINNPDTFFSTMGK